MIVIKNKQVYSDSGKYIRRIGSDMYFRRGSALPTDTVELFEEIDELPKYTEDEYKKKVEELISLKYSISDEIAIINNSKDNTEKHLREYDEYMVYRDECKQKAKEILNSK